MKDSSQRPLVLAVSTAFFPYIGGAEIALEELLARLPEHDRFVITARMSRDLPKREDRRGITIVRVGWGFFGDKLILPFGAFWQALKLSRGRAQVALVSVMISYGTLGFLLASRFSGRLRMHVWLQEGDSEEHLTRGKFGLVGLGWKLVLPHARVGALSASLARRAKVHGARDVTIIPNGVDEALFAGHQNQSQSGGYVTLVTSSRLVEKNGIEDVIASLVHMPEAKFIVAGDGPLRRTLEQKAKELGVGTRIEWLGNVPYRDLPKAFARAQVFVRPSRSEGFGIAFLDAMAAGLVVLAPMVGGIPDFFRPNENGLEIVPKDPTSIVRAMKQLQADPALAQRLIASGHKTAHQYDWSDIAQHFSLWIAN